ncbi:LacI family DNA-binding transcriptional regulator [Microbacterium sp. Kw_RZR3]|uniref:LacI family DNA-binding transcriptional regulator n=1 Tax=unclassified Microbacterium TaxID=2609290 RepID=UPI0023DABB44|nr:LacI family DNA-binding transcriptional regulator [Microbacterium sp. Kw_RZR3]MDF2048294.1 LacI family DNA-binding transcriptional regulator [Microbacterium sp. Kw_RZR3]
MVKIDEVARAAGVSISTVSYALSGKRPVSAETRLRIQDAVRELGYSPNAGARMLAGSQTNIFALSEPLRADSHAPSHMSFMHAMTVAARRKEYDMLLLTDEDASAGMKRVAQSGLVDAILVLDVAPDDARVEIARASATPTIFVGIPNDHDDLVCVDLDFERATIEAVDRLADAGHRAIGLIGGSERAYEKSNFPSRVRAALSERATERRMSATSVASGPVVTDRSQVRRAVRAFVEAGITGIVLHAPEEVLQVVLVELAALGKSVPGDVSIVSVGSSFDTDAQPTPIDSIPLVPQSSCELAVDLAIELIAGRPVASGLHLIAPTYLERGSVAAAPCA